MISVDTKKGEGTGRSVQERRPCMGAARKPVRVDTHDFPDRELSRVVPAASTTSPRTPAVGPVGQHVPKPVHGLDERLPPNGSSQVTPIALKISR